MKVAVCVPSRGTIYSQTIEQVLREVDGYDHRFFFSHAKPIPDCFNLLCDMALKDESVTDLWFVEEDMFLPKGVLDELAYARDPIAAVDYPVAPGVGSVRTRDGEVLFTGTGCLLVKREVFEKIGKPYFRTDIEYLLPDYTPIKTKGSSGVYGKHDVTFGMTVREHGYYITVVDKPAGQYRMVKRGAEGRNDGYHKIVTWTDINREVDW